MRERRNLHQGLTHQKPHVLLSLPAAWEVKEACIRAGLHSLECIAGLQFPATSPSQCLSQLKVREADAHSRVWLCHPEL